MSAIQIAVTRPSIRMRVAELWDRFGNWWCSLYADTQRPPRTIL
jgi:hypothetical protein